MQNIEVPKYVLENMYNTLRLCANHFNSYNKKTCLDRDIIGNMVCINKILNGEKLTGLERTESI